jgi:hypothetical protein
MVALRDIFNNCRYNAAQRPDIYNCPPLKKKEKKIVYITCFSPWYGEKIPLTPSFIDFTGLLNFLSFWPEELRSSSAF